MSFEKFNTGIGFATIGSICLLVSTLIPQISARITLLTKFFFILSGVLWIFTSSYIFLDLLQEPSKSKWVIFWMRVSIISFFAAGFLLFLDFFISPSV